MSACLRALGDEVLTVEDLGLRGQCDQRIAEFACMVAAVVVTENKKHFLRLWRARGNEFGVLVLQEPKEDLKLRSKGGIKGWMP